MQLTAHDFNVAAHVLAGAVALATGLVPMITAKGSRPHRIAGRVFVGLGAIVLVTAVAGVLLFRPPTALAAVTLSFSYQFLGGLRALALRGRGPGWPDALMAVAALSLGAAMVIGMGRGTASWTPMIGYSTVGYIAVVALYDLSRSFWADTWRRRVRPLDHGLKMTAAYFAMASAGAGNLLPDLQPWSQLLPSAAGLLAMLLLAGIYVGNSKATARTVPAAA